MDKIFDYQKRAIDLIQRSINGENKILLEMERSCLLKDMVDEYACINQDNLCDDQRCYCEHNN